MKPDFSISMVKSLSISLHHKVCSDYLNLGKGTWHEDSDSQMELLDFATVSYICFSSILSCIITGIMVLRRYLDAC